MRAHELIFAGVPGTELDPESAGLLAAHRPGGVVLLGWNFKTAEQLWALTGAIRAILPDVILAIDAEGGRVDRMRSIVGSSPAASLLGERPVELAREAGEWVARSMRLFDFDMDFAPVVDLDRGETGNALDGRYFGRAPEAVIARAGAFLAGLHAEGAGGCIKHFPGLGGAGQDTHLEGSVIGHGEADLGQDLAPFAALAESAGAVMVGHAAYPALDPSGKPATMSSEILDGILRRRLGFRGLTVSDDLEMKALAPWGDMAERSARALAAGCDVLLACHHLEELPGVIARLDAPDLDGRREEALGRLAAYRAHLRDLRAPFAGESRAARDEPRLAAVRAGIASLA